MTQPGGTALVLGGGGVTGIAWQIGVMAGLRALPSRQGYHPFAEALDVPGLVVGTSAGSVVGTMVAAAADADPHWDLADALAGQLVPPTSELASGADLDELFERLAAAGTEDPLEARRRIGEIALGTDDSTALRRREAVAARLPVHEWPATPLRVTAVDARSGEVVVLDSASGVALDDAVAASCAVPGVWPVVRIGGHDYMDGGVASMCHATLAAGYERVVVLVPSAVEGGTGARALADELDDLAATGAELVVVGPDPEYLAGPGRAALDPAGRPAAAELGQRFGRSLLES